MDAINNPEVEELYSYKIVSTNPEASEEDLEFKEAAEYIKTALSAKGMYEAPDVEHADMIIDLSYGVGEPQVEFKTYYQPVNGEWIHRGKLFRVELVGMEERVVPIIVYEKHIRLTSLDNTQSDESEGPVQAWSIYVKNKDQSDDLRKYLPLMAAAAIEYLGENTDSQQEIKVKKGEESVSFVKAGL